MDPAKRKELLDLLASPKFQDPQHCSDSYIGELEQALIAAADEAVEERDVGGLEALTEAIETVRNEAARRFDQAEADDARIVAMAQRIANPEPEPEPEPEPKPERPKLPSIAELNQRRPKHAEPVPAEPPGPRIVTAAGQALNAEEVAEEIHRRWSHLREAGTSSGRFGAVRIETEYPEDRVLGGDAHANMAKINAVVGPQALTASGGICAPSEAQYSIFNAAQISRPIRAALPQFQADHGGMRFIAPSQITDFDGGTSVHTNQNDIDGNTKPIVTVACGTETEQLVHAVTLRERLGNFHILFHAESFQHNIDLGMANHARLAEDQLFANMCTASLDTSAGEGLSAVRDLYAVVARAAAAQRNRLRMEPDAVLRAIIPAWVPDLLRADLVRQMPGDQTQAVSNSMLEAWLRNYGVTVTWTPDGNGQTFATQASGGAPLNPWPDTAQFLLFPEGSFLFLDGASLDLGLIRDSTLNSTNDAEIFFETFEAVAFVGQESLCITADLCPSGIVSGQDDSFAPCVTGS